MEMNLLLASVDFVRVLDGVELSGWVWYVMRMERIGVVD
jgi:hypothetical protein